jgi:hypothetical protein
MQETKGYSEQSIKSHSQGDSKDEDVGLQPIADLFLIAPSSSPTSLVSQRGSSTREPAQVFTLLQTLTKPSMSEAPSLQSGNDR